MADEKDTYLMALEMVNGMTYIGTLDKKPDINPVRFLRNVVRVPTVFRATAKSASMIKAMYKELYYKHDVGIPEDSSLALYSDKLGGWRYAVAVWYLTPSK